MGSPSPVSFLSFSHHHHPPPRAASGPWLHAWYDPVAGLKTFSQLLHLVDLSNENDFRLVVADTSDKKLKVYRGTRIASAHALVDTPVALTAFYPDAAPAAGGARVPSLAVASGPFVFVYRNLRPYMKFSLPGLLITAEESGAWEALHGGTATVQETTRLLSGLREGGQRLTSRSLDLLVLPPGPERDALVVATKGRSLVQQTVVTCLEALSVEREGPGEASTLILGTEACTLLYLDSTGSGIEGSCDVPSVPVQIVAHGTRKGGHRISVLCRDGVVYTVRDRTVLPTRISTGVLPVAIARTESEVVLATMDGRVTGFSPTGKRAWSVALPSPPTCMTRALIKRDRLLDCVIVACEGGLVRVLLEGVAVADLHSPDTVVALRFGQYGREANTLALVTRSGSLTFKMLRRTATFGPPPSDVPRHIPEEDVPLAVPKKTRLYLEGAAREREGPADMHRLFQRDLVKLRLSTARAYVATLKEGGSSLMVGSSSSRLGGPTALRLNASVGGLGPRFTLRLELLNVGIAAAADLLVVTTFDTALYACRTPLVPVPLVLPGLTHVLVLHLLCVSETGGADGVRVHVMSGTAGEGGAAVVPLITATISMPLSQPQPI